MHEITNIREIIEIGRRQFDAEVLFRGHEDADEAEAVPSGNVLCREFWLQLDMPPENIGKNAVQNLIDLGIAHETAAAGDA